MKIQLTILLLTISVSFYGQTNLVGKELEYTRARDRYIKYFKISENNHYNQTILDKQDSDSLLVLEKMLREILKDSVIDSISKNGKINLETLLPELGFGNLDGLVLNKNIVIRNSLQIFVTTQPLFFDYFIDEKLNSIDNLTYEHLDNIFTSAFGGGEARATTFSLIKKSHTKSSRVYGSIGSFGQDTGPFPPECIFVLVSAGNCIYLIQKYLNNPINELHACKSKYDSLNAESQKHFKMYQLSNLNDTTELNKTFFLEKSAWDKYCECYQKNFTNDKQFESVKNQIVNVMQYFEK